MGWCEQWLRECARSGLSRIGESSVANGLGRFREGEARVMKGLSYGGVGLRPVPPARWATTGVSRPPHRIPLLK